MTLDVSEAIALAKDLLQTSHDFEPHDPTLAVAFSERAHEICEDLGIDISLLGEPQTAAVIEPVEKKASGVPTAKAVVTFDDEETKQTSDQLRHLLQQQAEVLKSAREPEAAPKAKKRSFRLFSRSGNGGLGQLQTA
ncbi:MAG: hypothetical protein ACR2QJ_05705 [Geminicoccaceae bacterium]